MGGQEGSEKSHVLFPYYFQPPAVIFIFIALKLNDCLGLV